jgi:hypothetical protein
MKHLNKRYVVNLNRLKYNRRLTESKKEDDDNIKTIHIENHEDIINVIQYLLSILQRDLLIEEVVNYALDFEQIYRKANKVIDEDG